MTENTWQERIARLRSEQVVELAQRLSQDMLNGWLLVDGVTDYNIDGGGLVDLIEAAMSQHEQDDFDEHREGSRRAADLVRLGGSLDSIEAADKKVEADFAAGVYWWI